MLGGHFFNGLSDSRFSSITSNFLTSGHKKIIFCGKQQNEGIYETAWVSMNQKRFPGSMGMFQEWKKWIKSSSWVAWGFCKTIAKACNQYVTHWNMSEI